MITPMKKVTVFSMRENRKAVMEALQKMGCVELEKISDEENLLTVNVKDRLQRFERHMAQVKRAIELLDDISPEKKEMFAPRKSVAIENYSLSRDRVEKITKSVAEIIAKNKKLNENTAFLAKIQTDIMSFSPWSGLDIAMNFNFLKSSEVALYTISKNVTTEEIDELFKDVGEVYYEIISTKSDLSCIWFLFLKERSADVHKLLRENGFVPPALSLSHRTPEKKILRLQEKTQALLDENEKLNEDLLKLSEKRDDIKLLYDYMKLRHEKYENLEMLGETEKTFILSGFVPAKKADLVKSKIEDTALAYVEIGDIGEDEEAPVLFENNGFARPVEGITSTYSMPSKRDIDPNAIMAFFYYLFFGMMFSDAGYGILVMIGTGYLGFVKKYNKDLMKMFFYCGISTTVWGFLYGSFFGDLIYRFSVTFLGREITLSPIWMDPAKEPLTLLIFSVVLGLIQVLVGLSISFYMNWRDGNRLDAVFDTGSWISVILGVIVLVGGIVFKVSLLTTIGIVLLVLGALTVVLMKGRANKNIIMRLLSGILGLYDVTSYVSDALSYSRLMALGLATGVIAQVVNIMGTLAGGSVLGFIMFLVVFVVGHLLNFAINMLGAYVHTNRLQYVEFYSKFYEGGGKAFEPLAMNTEYYDFKEKNFNVQK